MTNPINPLTVTNYTMDDEQLQRFLLFGIIVAGKDSDWAAAKVGNLLRQKPIKALPLNWLKDNAVTLHNLLVVNRIGQYRRIHQAILEAAEVDLRRATVEELEGIFGVGPKTARFFILHTRPDAQVAVLDVHILKWLRELKVDDVPQQTPTSKKQYLRLEHTTVAFMKATFPGLTLAQADLLIWSKYSGRLNDVEETAGFLFDENDVPVL